MILYLIISILFVIDYVFLQVAFIYFWTRKDTVLAKSMPSLKVSVIVALRNEEKNVSTLLESLLNQDFAPDKYEIILVDNHSTDHTLSMIRNIARENPKVIVTDLSETMGQEKAFKKEALNAGIRRATGQIILTTDGDCRVGPDWIKTLVSELVNRSLYLVSGPVVIDTAPGFLEQYQQFDLSGLMVATAGGMRGNMLMMGNGANLAFRRDIFLAIGGYDKMPSVSSGDDVFLVQAINKIDPAKLGFVKHEGAVVFTKPVRSWYDFFQQRKRWASKASLFRHNGTQGVALVVAVNSFLICLHLILMLIVGSPFQYFLFVHLMAKIAVDTWLIIIGLRFLKKKVRVLNLFISHFINPCINVWVFLISILSKKYQWKGRITS